MISLTIHLWTLEATKIWFDDMVCMSLKMYYDDLSTIYLENQDQVLDFVGAMAYFNILIQILNLNPMVCRWKLL
jgi:hypothetical protein